MAFRAAVARTVLRRPAGALLRPAMMPCQRALPVNAWGRRFYAAQAEQQQEGAKQEEPKAEEAKEGHEDIEQVPDEREKEIADLKKSVAYALAEADNARKIAKKDVENARKYSLKSFAKDLLDVADNMERASGSVAEEDRADPKIAALLEGIRLTAHSLSKSFETHGILKMEMDVGVEFNPEHHEALFNIPYAEGKEPNTVGAVIKSGYTYHGRTLRAGQCGVVASKDD